MRCFTLISAFLILVASFGGSARADSIASAPGWSLDKISPDESADNSYNQGPVYYSLKPPDDRPAVTVNSPTADRLRNGELSAESAYSGRGAGGSAKKDASAQSGTGGFVAADPVNSTLTLEDGRQEATAPVLDATAADPSGLAGGASSAAAGGGGGGAGTMAGAGSAAAISSSANGGTASGSMGGAGGVSASGGGAFAAPASLPSASSLASSGGSSGSGQASTLVDDLPPEGSAAREIGNPRPSTSGTIPSALAPGFAAGSAAVQDFGGASVPAAVAAATASSSTPTTYTTPPVIPNGITDIIVTGINQHAYSGVGCPSGYTASGSIADSGGAFDGTYTYGRVEFCVQRGSGPEFVISVIVTGPNQDCPSGYAAAKTEPAGEKFPYCPATLAAYHAPCGNPQMVCLLKASNVAAHVLTNFYATALNQSCNQGDATVGQTNSIDSGGEIAHLLPVYFCATSTATPQ